MNTFHIKGKIRTLFGTPIAMKADFFLVLPLFFFFNSWQTASQDTNGLMEVSTLRCRSPSPLVGRLTESHFDRGLLKPGNENYNYHRNTLRYASCDNLSTVALSSILSDDRQRQHYGELSSAL